MTIRATQMAVMLAMLENNLELIMDFMDEDARTRKEEELTQYINTAVSFIQREGITLDFTDTSDCMLTVMYAGWLYDKRKDPTAPMPRMVRYNLNNRLFSEKVAE